MPEILTIGYGADTKKAFQDRICSLTRSHMEGMVVVDVRKENSRSRSGTWAYWGTEGMAATVGELGASYLSMPGLANTYGNTRQGMLKYEAAILPQGELRKPFRFLKFLIEKGGAAYCLLCAERKPFRGQKPNCHRVVLAERLAFELDISTGTAVHWLATHLD